jgi:hypothetical protein
MVLVFLVVEEILCYEPAASAGGGQQEQQGRGEAGLHSPATGILSIIAVLWFLFFLLLL